MEIRKSLEIDLDVLDATPDNPADPTHFPRSIQEYPISCGETIAVYSKSKTRDIDTCWIINRPEDKSNIFNVFNEAMSGVGVFEIGSSYEDSGWYNVDIEGGVPKDSVEWIQLVTSLFFEKVWQQERYPFIIDTTKGQKRTSSKSIKKRLAKEHNTVVYLGKPPVICKSTKNESDDVTKREFGYVRRPHRRTLKHERYRNHPKYGIYKGVHVSESWCGPKEFISKSRIYRLWQPSGIDTI